MASSRASLLPSDPEYLLAIMSEVEDESDSDGDFDGWLSETEEPAYDNSGTEQVSTSASTSHSSPLHHRCASVESLDCLTTSGSPCRMSPTPFLQEDAMHTSPSSSTQTDTEPPAPDMGTQPPFTATPGIIPNMEGKSPVDFFRLYFDEHMVQLIFSETCLYADQYFELEKVYLEAHPNARAHDWKKIKFSPNETDAFIALLIGMGLCGFPSLR